eukprot:TRINITY_DN65788_c0_g1_i1.p1 TRINITY_DN65788_c0_g1~~TRINITY_DN65788_c0_g1_i1.p1  ORF type:complete len:685 (+),score=220.09 TRINITY_DN65788_c0_g1_i1:109-2055(+)
MRAACTSGRCGAAAAAAAACSACGPAAGAALFSPRPRRPPARPAAPRAAAGRFRQQRGPAWPRRYSAAAEPAPAPAAQPAADWAARAAAAARRRERAAAARRGAAVADSDPAAQYEPPPPEKPRTTGNTLKDRWDENMVMQRFQEAAQLDQEEVAKRRITREYFEANPKARDEVGAEWEKLARKLATGDPPAVSEALMDAFDLYEAWDPAPKKDEIPSDVHWITWGSYVHHYRLEETMSLLQRVVRMEASVGALGALMLCRALHWSPEAAPGLIANGIVADTAALCAKCSRAPKRGVHSDELCRGDLMMPALSLFNSVISAALAQGNPDMVREAYASHPYMSWWRLAADEMDAPRVIETVSGACSLLLVSFFAHQPVVDELRPEDLDRLLRLGKVKALETKERKESPQSEQERQRFCIACGAIVLRIKTGNRKWIAAAHKAGWLTEMMSVILQVPRWRTASEQVRIGTLLGEIFSGLGVFSESYNKEMAHLGVPAAVGDKVRYGLGWMQMAKQRAENEKHRSDIERRGSALFEGACNCLHDFVQSELTERSFVGVAYNDERLTALRWMKLPGIMSRLMRIYPSSEAVVCCGCTITMMLLSYPEQAYAVRDAHIFQTLAICRKHMEDKPEISSQIQKVMKFCQDTGAVA